MSQEELAGFVMTAESAEEYFKRVIEAEKKMGPLTREERITILKSMGSAISVRELVDMMAGKRVLVVKDKDA
jgi:hypothetical protein